jgi:uncharacterized protein DUF6600
MKTTTRIALLALLLLGALAGPAPAYTSVAAGIHIGPSGRAAVDLGFFYDDLAPYGRWVERSHYGWCFVPHHRRAHWRPYYYGHWVWTDYGWTWVSDEPYGWATYHYGRWVLDPDFGWIWIPGDTWGPAWVSWQEGDDYIGWAPLPPSAEFSGNFGVDYGGVSFAASLTPEDYVFVPERQFLAPRVYSYAVPVAQVPVVWRETRNITNYRTWSGGFINQGVPVDRLQRVVGRSVPRYQVANLAPAQRHQERVAGNRVALFRPQVQRAARVDPPPARPIARRAVMTAAAAAATRQAAHAAHNAYLQRTAATRQQLERRQVNQGRRQQLAEQQNARNARQQQAQQRQAARQQQFERRQANQARQQQFEQRQATRQQQFERRQAAQARQQQAQQRQATRQQQFERRQAAQARQQQAQQRQAARQQQFERRQAAQARQQQAQQRQAAQAARQQARQQQAAQNRPPRGQGQGRPQGQNRPQGNPRGNRPKPPHGGQ